MREHFPIDADPGVPNPQDNVPSACFGRQPDPSARLRIFGRIVKKIVQHLLQPAGSASERIRVLGGRVNLELRWPRQTRAKSARFRPRGRRIPPELHGAPLTQWDLAVLDAEGFHQVLDQAAHALCLPLHQAPEAVPCGGAFPIEGKHLKRVTDRGQRGPLLMPELGE